MKIAGLKIVITVALVGVVSGCDTSKGVGRFIAGDTTKQGGPDEFGIVPTKPLVLPEDFAALPEPTPGGSNLTDHVPEQDAIAALGGRPERLNSTRVGAGEGALVAAAERNGTATNIRTVLAEEDKEFRKKNGPKILERLFRTDTYLKSYEDQTLQARSTNEQLRRKGVKTPTVSPEGDDD